MGRLECPNAQLSDQGAYSCEALNARATKFATPNAKVDVKLPAGPCEPPMFNALAARRDECITCFCFGVTDRCYSSELELLQVCICQYILVRYVFIF